jgi:hypothetical protein
MTVGEIIMKAVSNFIYVIAITIGQYIVMQLATYARSVSGKLPQ